MKKKEQVDQLQRLVHLISDDNELLSRASTFMQHLVDIKFEVYGNQDISAQLQRKGKMDEKHQ
ncbi:MAG: hypothetical protein IJR02_01345 [Bacteroidaceae bacterium]|nr:hypothetical protein [Bacteroidaceae bacterium]